MKKLIIAILLISAAIALASEPFVLEPIVPKKYQFTWDSETNTYIEVPIPDYLQIQRNFDKIARKIREGEYQADSSFVQKGTISSSDFTLAFGVYTAVVYLPTKYASASDYRVYFSRQAPSVSGGDSIVNQQVSIYTDSSFAITGDSPGNGAYWLTIGIRKK